MENLKALGLFVVFFLIAYIAFQKGWMKVAIISFLLAFVMPLGYLLVLDLRDPAKPVMST